MQKINVVNPEILEIDIDQVKQYFYEVNMTLERSLDLLVELYIYAPQKQWPQKRIMASDTNLIKINYNYSL